MKLGRLSTVAVKGAAAKVDLWSMALGSVQIRSYPLRRDGEPEPKELLLAAEIQLGSPPARDEKNQLSIPDAERRALEHALELFADTLSVVHRAPRSLASTIPSIALIPQLDEEKEWLDSTAGILRPPSSSYLGHIYPPDLEPAHIAMLSDRVAGVQLLSEVHSQPNVLGKYRSLARFFESALGLPFSQLGKKLAQFLKSGYLAYDRNEIEQWVALRHGAIHADQKVPEDLVFESDVWPYVGKMIDAAYDVLLNKQSWGSSSRSRRQAWKPRAYLRQDGGMVLTQGISLNQMSRLMDEFGVFPVNLTAVLSELPDGWWYRSANAEGSTKENS